MRKIPKYLLYYSKVENKITIKKQTDNGIKVDEVQDLNNAIYFNDYYFVSDNRNALIDKAEEIRDMWIQDYEDRLDALYDVKFKKLRK